MKKALLSAVLCLFVMTGYSQYYYIPFQNAGTNPGNLNLDSEYPVGGGLPAGWTSIHAGSAASPAWSSTQTIPFTFLFNGSAVTQYKVSTSGVLTFDVTAVTAPSYTRGAIPNAGLPDKSVAIWGLSGLASND